MYLTAKNTRIFEFGEKWEEEIKRYDMGEFSTQQYSQYALKFLEFFSRVNHDRSIEIS